MRAVNPRERDWLVTRARGLGWAKNSISLRSTPLDMAVKFLAIINTFLRKYDAIRGRKRFNPAISLKYCMRSCMRDLVFMPSPTRLDTKKQGVEIPFTKCSFSDLAKSTCGDFRGSIYSVCTLRNVRKIMNRLKYELIFVRVGLFYMPSQHR